MIEFKAYKCGCGKVYVSKKACVLHEQVCKSWKHPKHRTCKTCIFGSQISDSNGMEHEPQYLHTWRQWECSNPEFNYDIHFTPADPKVEDLNINCPVWQSKKHNKNDTEK